MKSIRLSLIVYFLVLLTGALGAVSWLSYRMTAQSLDQRKRESQAMIEAAYSRRVETVKAEIDRRLTTQARALASMRLVTVNYEAVQAASIIMPQNGLQAAVWLPYYPPPPPRKKGSPPLPPPPPVTSFGLNPTWLAPEPFKPRDPTRDPANFYPKFTHIDSSEVLVADAHSGQPQEFFQTYSGKDGRPMQRSESMGNAWFTLDQERREQAVLFTEYFDEVQLKPDVRVRRVTLKTPVSGFIGLIWPWRPNPNPNWKQPPPLQRPVDTNTPTLIIQYAADMGPIEEEIRQFQRERGGQLNDLESAIGRDLAQFRDRLIWVSLVTLIALWVGGYLVIRLGLAPLSKMSEAVSKVSVKNFHLPLQIEKLPAELRPIAERLVDLLEHLQNAFAREKQAAADISHELRTPLAALMTTLEVGLKKSRSPDEYREILEDCLGSGQHMYELVERLLTLARLDAGVVQYRAESTDVTELAMQCADMIRPLAKARGIALRLNLPEQAVTTETDATKLREVLINLLHNAVEYNKADGSIDLSVELIDGKVHLEVRDTGIGIKPEALARIFERFFRADPSRHADTPHAGLGLAIVKSFVDLMGGTIRVESSPAGTTFIVELPFIASIHDLNTAVQEMPALVQR